ncbi:MAG: DUF4238 domain-containing protein [Chitinophagales bacterium]|nr:DUF4238 domain-containing protein [Chitinophagales bacterium]
MNKKVKPYKSNHFVAKFYLKQWILDNNGIVNSQTPFLYFIHKRTKKILQDVPKNIAQKKNLYILPNEFQFSDKTFIEKSLINHFEQWYLEFSDKFSNNKRITKSDAYKICGFSIIQAFRSKFFLEKEVSYLKKFLNESGSDIWHSKPSLLLSFLVIKGFPTLIEDAEIVIYKSRKPLLTSDNPSSFWIETDDGLKRVTALAKNEHLVQNSDLRIICPINPWIIVKVKLFQPRKKSVLKFIYYSFTEILLHGLLSKFKNENQFSKKLQFQYKVLTEIEYSTFQKLIIDASDDIIVGVSKETLEYYL